MNSEPSEDQDQTGSDWTSTQPGQFNVQSTDSYRLHSKLRGVACIKLNVHNWCAGCG